MYAVIRQGSHQYRVSVGDNLLVDQLRAEVGATVRLEDVLLLGDSDRTTVDGEQLGKAVVIASVIAHRRGRKLRVMTYKPKKRHRRTLGYRSRLTELRVDDIRPDGTQPEKAARAGARTGGRTRAARAEPAEPEGVAPSPATPAAGDASGAEVSSRRARGAASTEEPAKPARPRRTAAKRPSAGRSTDGS